MVVKVILKYLKAFGGVGLCCGPQRQNKDLKAGRYDLEGQLTSVMFQLWDLQRWGQVEAIPRLSPGVVCGGPSAVDGQLDYDNPF